MVRKELFEFGLPGNCLASRMPIDIVLGRASESQRSLMLAALRYGHCADMGPWMGRISWSLRIFADLWMCNYFSSLGCQLSALPAEGLLTSFLAELLNHSVHYRWQLCAMGAVWTWGREWDAPVGVYQFLRTFEGATNIPVWLPAYCPASRRRAQMTCSISWSIFGALSGHTAHRAYIW